MQPNSSSAPKPAVQFTPQQLDAIQARGGTVLVNAAAGSGKTAVLVQRVIQRILDEQHPVDADRLLVATFSNAAAQEMKSRIAAQLETLSQQNPHDLRLARQRILMEHSSISTIHAFCLELIRENFQHLDLPVDFRVSDERETALLRLDTISEVVEESYRQEQPEFLALVELLSGGRNDGALFDTILRLYDFLRSHAFYRQWMQRQLAEYDPFKEVSKTRWAEILFSEALRTLRYAQTQLDQAISLAAEDSVMWEAYGPALTQDQEHLHRLSQLVSAGDWDGLYHRLWEHRFASLKPLRKYEDIRRKERVSQLRGVVKEVIGALQQRICTAAKGFSEDIADLAPKIHCLFEITDTFDRRFSQRKIQRRVVDFSDLEHFALELLYTQLPDGSHQPSALARELSQRYEEILVDEYQDTNEAQDAIFIAISREGNNRFMVGDVKQSIYGFRQAMPELFLQKSESYHPYDGKQFPAKIILGKNFRSREAITAAVNAIFSRLMHRETCQIEYDEQQALVAGASYPLLGAITPELVILDTGEITGDKDEAEAAYVAARIAKMLREGQKVTDHGVLRPVRPSDICILLRSPRGRAEKYLQALQREGIEGWSDSESGFLCAREVSVTLSVLRAVDNPLLDLPVGAALLSPIFGFQASELTQLRLSAPGKPLYLAMVQRQSDGTGTQKERDALALLAALRQQAAGEGACGVLQQLYDLTDYPAMVQIMPDGETRHANLMLLLEYAKQYEKAGYRGLSGFLRFVDNMEEQQKDLEPAVTLSEQAEVVRVMSIHRSKGLEFPVVFLSGLFHVFNLSDQNATALLHSRAGFACKRKSADGISWYTTVPREAVQLAIGRTAREEEMRILYVALTRAKERLIMTLAENQPEKAILSAYEDSADEDSLRYAVTRSNSFGRWLLLALSRHPDMSGLLSRFSLPVGATIGNPGTFDIQLQRCPDPQPVQQQPSQSVSTQPDPALLKQLQQQVSFVYPYLDAVRAPSKLAASQISQQLVSESGENPRFSTRPQFLTEEGLTPAERGEALHRFMQFCNYSKAAQDPAGEVQRLAAAGFLSQAEAESIPLRRVARFFSSPLAKRIFDAQRVHRELRFLAVLGEQELSRWRSDIRGDGVTTVQGVADCVFVEDGQGVIVDYKTDWVTQEEQLLERYRPQLELYRMILEKSLEIPVKECILYSFHLGKAIAVTP